MKPAKRNYARIYYDEFMAEEGAAAAREHVPLLGIGQLVGHKQSQHRIAVGGVRAPGPHDVEALGQRPVHTIAH